MTVLGAPHGDVSLPFGDDVSLALSWVTRTDVGKRRTVNEDSLVAVPPLFAVADGMGGHAAGDLASDLAVTGLANAIVASTEAAVDALDAGLRAAAGEIDALSMHLGAGAGTTATGVVVAVVDGECGFLVFNIGDSRVYVRDDAGFRAITVDHSVVQELVDAGLLTEREAENHPDSNVITHALGFGESPEPDVWFVPARAGQRILICSDGLTKELDHADLAERLAHASLESAADSLLSEALDRGGRDNITFVAIDVLDAPAPTGIIRALRRRRTTLVFGSVDTLEQPTFDHSDSTPRSA